MSSGQPLYFYINTFEVIVTSACFIKDTFKESVLQQPDMAKRRIYGVNSNISPKEVLINYLTAVGGDSQAQ